MVHLAGELDLASADVISRYLEHCVTEGHAVIAVDLSEVTFADARGLATFVVVRSLLDRIGGSLTLRHPRPAVRKVLEVTGLDRMLVDPDGRRN